MKRSEIYAEFGPALKRNLGDEKLPPASTLENAVKKIAADLPVKSSSGGNSTL